MHGQWEKVPLKYFIAENRQSFNGDTIPLHTYRREWQKQSQALAPPFNMQHGGCREEYHLLIVVTRVLPISTLFLGSGQLHADLLTEQIIKLKSYPKVKQTDKTMYKLKFSPKLL